ncbi:MAG: hypothetical protein WD844_02785 [Thermoleophilaceae bacterium]
MTARKLVLTTAAIASTLAFAAPAAQAAEAPPERKAQAAGLLTDINDLLAGTVGAVVDQTGTLVAQIDPTQGVLTDLTGQVIGTVDTTTGSIFDTTGQLLATVDAETGLLLDPLGNIIGAVLPATPSDPNTGGGGGNPGTPAVPGANNGPFGNSPLSLALSASRTQRLATVARRGLSATASCSATCGVLAAVTVDGRTAKRLGLGRGTKPEVIGTAITGAGRLPIRISSRSRRALSAALPTSRTRKSIRSKRVRAFRKYRSRKASRSQRRKARSSYLRYRKIERRWIRTGRVKFIVAAVGMDPGGRTTTIRRQSLIVKR